MSRQRKNLGNKGEDLAVSYLISKKYRIRERNHRSRFGEIDIIAKDRDYIVLVEVKTKTIFDQGSPEEMVDYFKQKKLRLLAREIIKDNPQTNIRIDVIAIDLTTAAPKVNHIINAVEEI